MSAEQSELVRVHGRALQPGTEVSITGVRGRYRFVRASTTSSGRVVLDFIGGQAGHECWRSFYPERVKIVHRIDRRRSNSRRRTRTPHVDSVGSSGAQDA